jgi:site-specific DNA-cytosine methylase
MTRRLLILSLCDHTGNWSRPYAEDPAYEVVRVDALDGQDVRLLSYIDRPVHGILAAPPCTDFSTAQGVRSWGKKGTKEVIEAMSVVDACMRAVAIYRPYWWALENPPGRLRYWIGAFSWSFQPYEYGRYLETGEKTLDCSLFPANDAFTKRTLIWGTARKPLRKPVSVTHVHPEGGWNNKCFNQHKGHRSVTPMGFSRAFKEANP